MRVFQPLVVALGHREDRHFGLLAKVEHRWAYKIADILDDDDRARPRLQQHQPARHHIGLEVTARAGIDLHNGRARGANTFTVIRRRLIAFDHEQRKLASEIADGALEQCRLARSRR
jgi:hypothetical protein